MKVNNARTGFFEVGEFEAVASVAMKLVGHKTESMYRRHAIVAGRDLRVAGARVAAVAPASTTTVVPFPTAQATG
jgi:hypothetical protein